MPVIPVAADGCLHARVRGGGHNVARWDVRPWDRARGFWGGWAKSV